MYADTWLIVPMYHEENSIQQVLETLLATFKNVVAIDDGSTDATYKQASHTGAHILRHRINLGQGAALQTGIDYALSQKGARYFITFDADGQHTIADAKKMLSAIKKEGVDIVTGSRFLTKQAVAHIPFKKKMALKTVIGLRSLVAKTPLTDMHNGLRVFNRSFAEHASILTPRMGHASEIINRIHEGKFTYKEVPVTIHYTENSLSDGQPLINGVNILFELVTMKYLRNKK